MASANEVVEQTGSESGEKKTTSREEGAVSEIAKAVAEEVSSTESTTKINNGQLKQYPLVAPIKGDAKSLQEWAASIDQEFDPVHFKYYGCLVRISICTIF